MRRRISGSCGLLVVLLLDGCCLLGCLALAHPSPLDVAKVSAFQKTLADDALLPCDVVILLDESTSIRAYNFRTELKLMESVARLFRVGANETRFAVVTYSTTNRIHFNYISSSHGDICNFLSGMKKIDYKGGWTFTKDALFTAENLLRQGRHDSKKIIILIADGRSNEADPIAFAKSLKENGFVIFAVGIGPHVDAYELKNIASSPLHVLMVKDFDHVPALIDFFRKDVDRPSFVRVDDDKCPEAASRQDARCPQNSACFCMADGNYVCGCRAGYRSEDGTTRCTECPVGTYKDRSGWGRCVACPENSNTSEPGAASLGDCKCDPGFYGQIASGSICKPKHCPKLSTPAGGDLLPANCGNSVGDRCSFFCNAPYCPRNANAPDCSVNASGTEQSSRTCLPTTEWSGEEFLCERAGCPLLEAVAGGYYECDGGTNVGSRCHLRCRSGLEPSPSAEERSCLSDGAWENTTATCAENDTCSANFCENGGTCYFSSDGLARCSCPNGVTGARCDAKLDRCDDAACFNNGKCIDEYVCACAPGYSGIHCETDVDECDEGACINGGTCVDEINGYRCICPTGTQGKHCEISPRECDAHPCQNEGRCLNTLQGYSCCCPPGFFGSECESSDDDCRIRSCQNEGLCTVDATGRHACLCLPDYWGDFCEHTHPCDASACENGGTCVGVSGNQSCRCLPGFTGGACETETSTDFDFVFEPLTISNYAVSSYDADLHAITVSFWMRLPSTVDEEQRGTPISIGYFSPVTGTEIANGLTWYDARRFIIYLHGKPLRTNIAGARDGEWHHYAFTWDASTGDWSAYEDGASTAHGARAGVGVPLWKGSIVIGQEQDFVGGGFQLLEAFHGALTQVNVWDYAMSGEGVRRLGASCGQHGNVLDWSRARGLVRGSLHADEGSSLCKSVGFCQNSSAGCLCQQKKDCADARYACSDHLCQNGGFCGTPRSECVCPPGYVGTHCQLDADECLVGNGNCSHACVNLLGSYRCECPPGLGLIGDAHACAPLKYCSHGGRYRSDGHEWDEGCDRCRCVKGRVKCFPKKCPGISDCLQNERWAKLPGDCCGRCLPTDASCRVDKFAEYTTFDQFQFKFSGNCRYTLARDCSDASVDVALEIGNKNSFRKLIVAVGCSSVEIFPSGQFLVDGAIASKPYVDNAVFAIYPTTKPYPTNGNGHGSSSSKALTIVTRSGIVISWKAKGELGVDVPRWMRHRMCGLCGNFMLTSSFLPADTFSQFVLSWQVDGDRHCDNSIGNKIPGRPSPDFVGGRCTISDPGRKLALRLCAPLREAPFYPCYASVNPKKHYELCVQDACSCGDGDDALCHCGAISSYVAECRGFNVSVGPWEGMHACASRCRNGTGMVFSTCGPPCPRTCAPGFDDPRCEIRTCRIGCHCPTHLVLHEGRCIAPSDC